MGGTPRPTIRDQAQEPATRCPSARNGDVGRPPKATGSNRVAKARRCHRGPCDRKAPGLPLPSCRPQSPLILQLPFRLPSQESNITNDAKRVVRRWRDGSRFGLRAIADLLGCDHRRAKMIVGKLIDSGWAEKIDRTRDLYRLSSRGCDLGQGLEAHANPLSADKEA